MLAFQALERRVLGDVQGRSGKTEDQRAGCPDEAQYVRERRLVARANSGGMTVAPGLRVT